MKSTALKYVANITLGKMLQSTSTTQDQSFHPYLQASSIQANSIDTSALKEMPFHQHEKKNLHLVKDDILVVEGGDVGKSAFVDINLQGIYYQNSLNRVRTNEANDAKFIYYNLVNLYNSGYYEAITNRATIRHLTAEKLANCPVFVTSKHEQRRIAEFLDRETAEIDAFMADQKRLLTLLKERWQSELNEVVHTGVNEIPLVAFAEPNGFFDGDWIESKDQDPDGTIRLLQLADIGDGTFKNKSSRFITENTANRLACSLLKPGDILIARMPDPLGRACLLPENIGPAITAVDIAVLRVEKTISDSRYVAYALNSEKTRGNIKRVESGATRQRISRKNLGRINIPFPTLGEQRIISDHLDRTFSQLTQVTNELIEAIELSKERRSALISAAVTGQIDVSDRYAAEKVYEEVESST